MTTMSPQLKTLTPQVNFGQQATQKPLAQFNNEPDVFFGAQKETKGKKKWLALPAALALFLAACGGDADDYSGGSVRDVGSCDNGNNGLFIETEQSTVDFGSDHIGYDVNAVNCDGNTAFEIDTNRNRKSPLRIDHHPPAGLDFSLNQDTGEISFTINGEHVTIDAIETGAITVNDEEAPGTETDGETDILETDE